MWALGNEKAYTGPIFMAHIVLQVSVVPLRTNAFHVALNDECSSFPSLETISNFHGQYLKSYTPTCNYQEK